MTLPSRITPDRRPDAVVSYQTTSRVRFPRILLVNQDRSFGRLLREALSFHGLHAIIEQEPSPDSALARLATISRWKIRLVLIALPLMHGGLGLISDIRYRSLAPAVPMLSLEDGAQSVEMAHALRLGADACMPRPQRWDGYGAVADRVSELLVLHDREDGTSA